MSIGERIKKTRIMNGVSQNELAAKIFVSRQTISKWENDVLLPDLNNLVELAKFFHCTINTLIDGKESEFVLYKTKEIKRQKVLKYLFLSTSIVSFSILLFILFLSLKDITTYGTKINTFGIFAFCFYFLFLIFITLFIIRIIDWRQE